MDAGWKRAILSSLFRLAVAATLGGSALWWSSAEITTDRPSIHDPFPGRASGPTVEDMIRDGGQQPSEVIEDLFK